jgi:hypothetical protein
LPLETVGAAIFFPRQTASPCGGLNAGMVPRVQNRHNPINPFKRIEDAD